MPPPAHGIASRLIAGPTLRTQSDRRLVGLVREGYEAAFEEIVRRYGGQLGRYAAAIVGGRSEDVTQDAFSKALLALRRDDGEIELRPWLYRIVRNTALNDLRDQPAAAVELAEAIATGSNPAETLEHREELTKLMERLRALPEAQRAAIVMRELEGLSHVEIAAALGMSGGAARQAIYRGRRALRDAAGMLVPLPLLRTLLTDPASAEAAGGAAGLAGAGIAVKATAATVLVAGTVGTGVALQVEKDGKTPRAKAGAVAEKSGPETMAGSIPSIVAAGGDPSGGPRPDGGPSGSSGEGRGGRDSGEKRSGPSGPDSTGPDSSGPSRKGSEDDMEDSGSGSGSGSESSSGSGSGSGSRSGSSGGDSFSGGSSTSGGSESSGSGSSETGDPDSSGSSESGSSTDTTSDSSGSGSGSEPTSELDSDGD
jgi:RNA polymerase sigma factor (sigma-70 family)